MHQCLEEGKKKKERERGEGREKDKKEFQLSVFHL